MRKGNKCLTWTDRLQIEAWERAGVKQYKMAEMLGVDPATISRELKRGRYERLDGETWIVTEHYSPDIAQQKADENRARCGAPLKIGKDHEYAQYLEYKIHVEKYSPGAVLGEIEREGLQFDTKISKTTLYRYIDDGLFLTVTNKDLPIKKNKKKTKYKKVRANRRPISTSIEKRPAEINLRERFGDWEMDCVVGKQTTKKTLLVLTERKTRREIVRLMPRHTAECVVAELDKIERSMGAVKFREVFKTITCDNGHEFMDWRGIERSAVTKGARTTVYFCHPYTSCERGSNENANRLVRRHYPKGYDFTKTTKKEISKLEKWINNYPREMFGWHTSGELYEAYINSIFAA